MNANLCQREAELVDALASGRWPDACDREMRAHVEACAECAELALVATSIDADRRSLEHVAAPPPSGAVWWRMQMRLEREMRDSAAKTARRAHSAVVLATLGIIVTLLLITKLLGSAWAWLAAALPRPADLHALQQLAPSMTMMVAVAAAVAVITPVLVWLAVAEE
jgi:hypothetical protein